MTQLSLESIVNKNLFSNYYLENLIQNTPEWKKDDHIEAFEKIKTIYNAEMAFLEGLNESQLEKRFFRRIFKILLPDFEVQATTKTQEFPDYAFFPNKQALDDAHESKGTKSFYVNSYAIGEVKRWNVELDKFGKDKHDKRRNPSFQIWLYLNETEPKWGILSNGHKWRLYHEERPLDYYYETDLITLIKNDDLDGFKYFYYFFRKEAFLPSETGEIFIETVLNESANYAKEVGENLKENIYKAMKKIADGFYNWSQNNIDINDEAMRQEVQKSSMRLLYRFLFLLYSEGRNLLDLKNEMYRNNHSFFRLKKEISDKKEGSSQDNYSPASTAVWSKLKDLFRLIDLGSKSFGISSDQFHVPAYNGGLFDPSKNPNLEKWTIGDTYIADAIDLLARSEINGKRKGFVDYSTLDIRHIGSIYEGLLEYKLMIAEGDMVVKGGEKKKEWVTLEVFNKGKKQQKSFLDFDEFDKVKSGEIYLSTDKGERKVTGSYYTPDYIVNYIVETTIGPVIEEKWKEATINKNSFVEATLSIKVLDPAMGSGHFLVGAIEFIAIKLLKGAQKDIESGLVKDDGHFTTDWAKRDVISHCIYGVDLNDLAVELTKVSLWLTTISKDKPLSFLDHRLKQGNSLIGIDLKDLPFHPSTKINESQIRIDIPRGFIKKLVDTVNEISSINDDTLANIRKKEEIFEEFKKTREYDMIKTLADVRTSIYFGNEIDEATYGKYSGDAYFSDESEWKTRRNRSFASLSREIANEKCFFHWELEFPEIFFEEGKQKDNPGFDAIIGNPPWEKISASAEEKNFLEVTFKEIKEGEINFYPLFLFQCGILTKVGGKIGQLVPNTWLINKFDKKLRKYILESFNINEIFYLCKGVFPDAPDTMPVILIEEMKNQMKPIEKDKSKVKAVNPDLLNHENFLKDIAWEDWAATKIWYHRPLYQMSIYDTEKNQKMFKKIEKNSVSLGTIARSSDGIYKSTVEKLKTSEEGSRNRPIVESASQTNRYYLKWNGYFIPEILWKKHFSMHNGPKIVLHAARKPKLKRRLVATYSEDEIYFSNRFIIVKVNHEKYKPTCILALLNSKVLNWYFKLRFPITDVDAYMLDQLPIKLNASTVWDSILELIMKQDFSIPNNYINNKEISELLSYFSENLLTFRLDQTKEISGFLFWLETELQTTIENFTNKTLLKKYYELSFDELMKILKMNYKKIHINLSNRDFQENLKREYVKSTGILTPLFDKIKKTDWIIDQIIYQLYGFNEEEIQIVNEALD